MFEFPMIPELTKKQFPERPWLALVSACLTAGIFMSFAMAPCDFIATRFYNQGTNANGKGIAAL
jgi:hypothetical protein